MARTHQQAAMLVRLTTTSSLRRSLLSTTSTPRGPSRRAILCGLALAPGALAAVSACSGGTVPPGGTTTPGGTPGGGTTVPLAEVPVGGATIVQATDGPVLVTQPEAGTVRAYSAICPHQGVTVGLPENGVITCSAHGSQFDAATGDVTQGPATSGLPVVEAQVVGDTVQLS